MVVTCGTYIQSVSCNILFGVLTLMITGKVNNMNLINQYQVLGIRGCVPAVLNNPCPLLKDAC